MSTFDCDVVVVGAGAAGLAASALLLEGGHRVALIEREDIVGGILNQCIHNGFGLHYFDEELTGPEYAERFAAKVDGSERLSVHLGTTVMEIRHAGDDKEIIAYAPDRGLLRFRSRAVVLAMGCRERNRGNIGIPGTRPAGVYTAGLAQRLVNIEGYIPGKRVVIVGSGDIGLIMARRMTWIGAKVLGVVEIQPYPSGLTRNIVQCLNDFSIPLHLSHVVSRIHGRDRVEAVDITPLAEGKPDSTKSFTVDCDTLLLSVGLIPENELSKKIDIHLDPQTGGPTVDSTLQTSVPGIFACGNVLHVHDLVDFVSEEAERCAMGVSDFIAGVPPKGEIAIRAGANIRYVVPGRIRFDADNTVYARSLIVKNGAVLTVRKGEREIMKKKLRHVQPSEMIGFSLSTKDLEEATVAGDEPGNDEGAEAGAEPVIEVGLQ